MGKPTLQIQFPPAASTEFMHRVLNFIEDVHRTIDSQALGSIANSDNYGSGGFYVSVASTRHLGEVNTAISRLLKQHMLAGDAVVTRGK